MTLELIKAIANKSTDYDGFSSKDRASIISAFSGKVDHAALIDTIHIFDDLVVDAKERARLIRHFGFDAAAQGKLNKIIGSKGFKVFRTRYRYNYDLAMTAYKLGINTERFNILDLKKIVLNRLNKNYADYHDPRPLAVVIYARSQDWNGAFRWKTAYTRSTHFMASTAFNRGDMVWRRESVTRYKLNSTELAGMMKHYRVLYYEASTEDELIKHFKEATSRRKAALVLLGGHGDQKHLSLGAKDPATSTLAHEKYYLDTGDAADLRGLGSRVLPGAHIVLVSCSNGKGGPEADNVVRTVSEAFPKAYVYGIDRVGSETILLDDKGGFKGIRPNGNERLVIRNKHKRVSMIYQPVVRTADSVTMRTIIFPQPTDPAIAAVRKRSARPELFTALNHTNKFVRLSVANLAGRMGVHGFPVLKRALKDRSAFVKHEAIRSLGMQTKTTAAQILLGALQDPAAGIRSAAVEALAAFQNPWAGGVLVYALFTKPFADIKYDIIRRIGNLKDRKTLWTLMWATSIEYPPLQIAAARAMRYMGGNRAALNTLVALLLSKRRDIRWAAWGSLKSFDDRELKKVLARMSKSDIPRVRRVAEIYLRKLRKR